MLFSLTRTDRFQEYSLARRRLIFVNGMMYFRCRGCTFAEDVEDSRHHIHTDKGIPIYQMDEPDSFRMLSDYLWKYGTRDLTDQSDALNAMAGICRRVASKAKCSFLQGMPVAAFDLYVLFFPPTAGGHLERFARRPGFPSWSWAGWQGPVNYTRFPACVYHSPELRLSVQNKWLTQNTWIVWHKRDPSGVVSPVWDAGDGDTGDIRYGHREPFRPPPGLEDLQTSQVTPTEYVFTAPAPPYHVLQFWTLVVHFTVQKSSYGRGYLLLDHAGLTRGIFFVDSEAASVVRDGGTAELAVLSLVSWGMADAVLHRLMKQVTWEDEFYVALYIERDNGVAERRGIGFVNRTAVARSLAPGPAWKEIVLA